MCQGVFIWDSSSIDKGKCLGLSAIHLKSRIANSAQGEICRLEIHLPFFHQQGFRTSIINFPFIIIFKNILTLSYLFTYKQ